MPPPRRSGGRVRGHSQPGGEARRIRQVTLGEFLERRAAARQEVQTVRPFHEEPGRERFHVLQRKMGTVFQREAEVASPAAQIQVDYLASETYRSISYMKDHNGDTAGAVETAASPTADRLYVPLGDMVT